MKIHYLIYKTTCLINNKIYIGKHKTTNIEDNYFGSGKCLQHAIKKYGLENFEFKILIDLNNEIEMNELERLVVNSDFIQRNDVYNLCIGGDGGNIADVNNQYTSEQKRLDQKKYYKKLSKHDKELRNKKRNEGYQRFKENDVKFKLYCQHISETNSKKHGEETSSFGTIWLSNIELHKNKRVNKQNYTLINTLLNTGWKIGRLKFNFKNKQTKQNSINNLKSNNTKGMIYITNGVDNKLQLPSLPIPSGWKRGRYVKKNQFKIIRIYNIETNERRKIRENEIIPEGWKRCNERNKNTKLIYINNPITNEKRLIANNDPLPDGFVLGFGVYNNGKNKKIRIINTSTNETKLIEYDETIPDGWIKRPYNNGKPRKKRK